MFREYRAGLRGVGVSAVWNGADWRGQVTVPSGRWGWAQELIGSLWFDPEHWWQVCVARPSEPRCIFTVSQGIATTVTAHQGTEKGIEEGAVRGGEMRWRQSKDRFTFLYSSSHFSFLFLLTVLYLTALFGSLWIWTIHLPAEKGQLWPVQSQL